MPRGQSKTYVPVTLDTPNESAALVTDPNEIKALAPAPRGYTPGERSDVMKQFDGYCEELYTNWVETGKQDVRGNKAWAAATCAIRKVTVPADQADTVKFLANKSAQFLGHSAVFGKGDAKTKDGRSVVSFRCVDPRPRASKNGTATAQ